MYIAGSNITHSANMQNTTDNQKAKQNTQPKSLHTKVIILCR
jgi:hypothetical protein